MKRYYYRDLVINSVSEVGASEANNMIKQQPVRVERIASIHYPNLTVLEKDQPMSFEVDTFVDLYAQESKVKISRKPNVQCFK